MSLFDLQDVCKAIGSIATLDLPMVVDLIGIYGLKGPYCTLTTTDWFLQALSVIPRGSWGDVARRFTMIRWATAVAAAAALRRRKFVSGQLDEENPFVQNSLVLLVQADQGVSVLVVDRIGDIYHSLPRRADVIVTTVGARHKSQQGPKILKFQNQPKRARYRIPARKLHGLPETGPNKTLEEISRHDITGASPERRPPAAAPPRNHAHRKGARERMAARITAQPCTHPAACIASTSAAHRRPASDNRVASARSQGGHHRRNAAGSGASPAQLSAASALPHRATKRGQRASSSRAMRGHHAGVVHARVRGGEDGAPPCAVTPWPM
ncbi:hypothetical protein F511_44405 [Dorcoceras hygrometricum]|uniref:Acyl-CoA dehydrogenase-related protein n=1 Tax=Dorcoceras hygrometricum TaxID=472368 RepID=A0A2Z7A5F3_9LAMI|nr:hypothetical protein F511_44405 [Dorcoceras hygrometricum]